jgi:hypothetical protein
MGQGHFISPSPVVEKWAGCFEILPDPQLLDERTDRMIFSCANASLQKPQCNSKWPVAQ